MHTSIFKEKLVSIIVPVYNCCDYLEACVNSIVSQTYCYLEIILVDDGSNDGSGELCEKLGKQDRRIKVIHKENGGILSARVAGIQAAKGEYIGFVDADDTIELMMYDHLIRGIEDCDMITSGLFKYGPEGRIIDQWQDLFEEGVYELSGEYFIHNLIIHKNYAGGNVVGGICNNLVCKLFKTGIARDIVGQININVKDEEDFLFLIIYVLKCKKVRITHDCYYHYLFHGSSVSNTYNDQFLTERTNYYQAVMNAISEHWAQDILEKQFQRRFMFGLYSNTAKKLNIHIEAQYPVYQYPEEEKIADARIAIYGAGQVGKSYVLQWKRKALCEIVGWYDGKAIGEEVLGIKTNKIEDINEIQFDYIICAVLNKNRAQEMKKHLIELGVPERKICWHKPINIWRNYFLFEH